MPAGEGPTASGRDAQRFAAALDRRRPLGSVDAELLGNLQVVAMLRSRSGAYAPAPDAKARAKQRLVAILTADQAGAPAATELTTPLGRVLTPSFPTVAEVPDIDVAAVTTQLPVTIAGPGVVAGPGLVAVDTPAPNRSGRRSGRHARPRRAGPRHSNGGLGRRATVLGSAAMITAIALAGGGILAGRDALPGDDLYALKQVSETAGLALTFDTEAKARRHLALATTRIDEVELLVARQPADPAPPEVYEYTIQEFDALTGEGTRMLLATEDAGGTTALGDLRTWAAEQVVRLSGLRSSLPAAAVSGADGSIELLDRLLGRTEALEDRVDCTEVTSGVVDDLGPLPAESTCAPRPVDPTSQSGTPGPTGSTTESAVSTPDSTAPGTPGPTTGERPNGTGAPVEEELLPAADSPELDGGPRDVGRNGTSTTPSTQNSGDAEDLPVPAPLPLLPSISLPPLPGQPGVTIG